MFPVNNVGGRGWGVVLLFINKNVQPYLTCIVFRNDILKGVTVTIPLPPPGRVRPCVSRPCPSQAIGLKETFLSLLVL